MFDLEKAKRLGIDVESGIHRFAGNEGLFLKFLWKFKEDTNFAELEEAILSGDFDTAFKKAHTLKGITGNLSMTQLYRSTVGLTESLRREEPETCVTLFSEVKEMYEKMMELYEE